AVVQRLRHLRRSRRRAVVRRYHAVLASQAAERGAEDEVRGYVERAHGVRALQGPQLAQEVPEPAFAQTVDEQRALVVRIPGQDLVRALAVQDDGGAVLAAELEDSLLGQARQRERRLLQGAHDRWGVGGHPARVEGR